LDGKHSEVEAETTIDCYTENQIKNMDWEADNDGKQLYHKLEKIFKNHGLNLDEEIKIVEDYLNSLDTYIDVTVRVKKSNADKVIKYCNNL
jgi:hypothetical protein